MKNNFYFIFLIFISYFNYAQNVIVFDSLNKYNIPYVAIQYEKNGLYTDEKGVFKLIEITSDSLFINHYGYNSLKLAKKNLKDTIYLKPIVQKLEEVLIKNKYKTIVIKQPKSTRFNGDFPISKKTEIISIVIPEKNIKNSIIKEISFKIKKLNKSEIPENIEDKWSAVLRINIYNIENGLPVENIFSSEPKTINVLNDNNIILAIEKEYIKIPYEGLGFGIEFIGTANNNVNEISFIRPALTSKESNNDMTFKSILRFTLDKSKTIIYIDKFNQEHIQNTPKNIGKNLKMGFVFLK
ncbi:MAG: hypothetical protein COB12_10450 [Flavobacterium sp.]|nr:MAG: hypothetical protein COB12_10450 [Flavobacterium sp.]